MKLIGLFPAPTVAVDVDMLAGLLSKHRSFKIANGERAPLQMIDIVVEPIADPEAELPLPLFGSNGMEFVI